MVFKKVIYHNLVGAYCDTPQNPFWACIQPSTRTKLFSKTLKNQSSSFLEGYFTPNDSRTFFTEIFIIEHFPNRPRIYDHFHGYILGRMAIRPYGVLPKNHRK